MIQIIQGDCRQTLKQLPSESVQCCVTSPPYWGMRDYGGEASQIGIEATSQEFIAELEAVFAEVYRILKPDGIFWLNIGDSYAGSYGAQSRARDHVKGLSAKQIQAAQIRTSGTGSLTRTPGLKAKDLIGIPWRLAFALQAFGWYLRADVIWHKPNPMPESVTDRPTKSHEYLFLLAKSERYYYNAEAIKEPATDTGRINGRNGRQENPFARPPGSSQRKLKRLDYSQKGRNKRSVWTIPVSSYNGAHFATFPPELIRPCILAGSKPGDAILDPFAGSGTTGSVAIELGRKAILCELNAQYIGMIKQRTNTTVGLGF